MEEKGLSNRLFVITGGPGSGKTMLIEALAYEGLLTTAESGRKIIQDQILTRGDILPWSDPAAFAELMLKRRLSNMNWHCNLM